MTVTVPTGPILQQRLSDALARHGVPGAVIGLLAGGAITVRSGGLTRTPGGAPITADTLFLIASVTKVWTATMVLQLVDEGSVELDAPVNRYLDPPLRLAEPDVADAVTVGQLLTHSGGFFGDAEEPPDADDDAVAQTVAGYATLTQLHRPGTMFSYSNAGYNVLGRLVECLTNQNWDDALETRLVRPLGLTHTFTRLVRAATHPLAVGHEPRGPHDRTLAPVETWCDPRGSGPCGGTLCTTASDLLRFAALHIADGLAPNGRRLLSAEAARLMRQAHIPQPDPSDAPGWGLGWAVARLDGPQVVDHGGNTCGQESHLVVVPERELAVCVLTNGDYSGRLRKELVGDLLRELADVDLPDTPPPSQRPDGAPDPGPALGVYQLRPEARLRVDHPHAGDELRITLETSGDTARRVASFDAPLMHSTGQTYLFRMPELDEDLTATFVHEDGGPRASHVAIGLRLAPRVETP